MNFIYDALGVVFGPIMSAIYQVVQNYGVAIILFTLFCRILMLPSAVMQQKSAAKNQRMQLKMRKMQEKYKDDPQRLRQEQQDFYQREGYNPMSAGCSGGMLLQFPIMFGLIAAIYRPLQYTLNIPPKVFTDFLTETANKVFVDDKGKVQQLGLQLQMRVVEKFGEFKHLFEPGSAIAAEFGVEKARYWSDAIVDFAGKFQLFGLNLGLTPKEGDWRYYLIPVLAGVTAMLTSVFTMLRQRKTNPSEKQNFAMMGCTVLGMPLMSAFFAVSFPVGIGMYWIAGSVFSFIQTVILSYTHPPQKMLAKVLVDETITRRSRENSRKKIAAMD